MVALSELAVDIVASGDEARFRDLMEAHHYLGALPGMAGTGTATTSTRARSLCSFIPCPAPLEPGSGRPISTPACNMECRR